MTIDEFIEQAWAEHEEDLAGVTARLPRAWPLLEDAPAQLGELVQLVEHVLLAHHGDAQAMQPWLARFALMLPRQPEAAALVERARLAARLLEGNHADVRALDVAGTIRAHGSAACGLVARGEPARAGALMRDAAQWACDAAADRAAQQAFAACCNNVATQLLHGRRGAEADALMIDMAARAREAWQRAGTWLDEERADYLQALCATAVGDGGGALAHARRCLAVCEANRADAGELFFAHEALARAQRARGDGVAAAAARERMRVLLADVADDGLRRHAETVLQQLTP